MKLARILLCLLAAVIFILAGLGAAKTTLEGLKEGEIMSTGRRSSTLVIKDREPNYYWANVIGSGVISAGLFGGGVFFIFQAFKPRKKK